jgi:hypothetical protein
MGERTAEHRRRILRAANIIPGAAPVNALNGIVVRNRARQAQRENPPPQIPLHRRTGVNALRGRMREPAY